MQSFPAAIREFVYEGGGFIGIGEPAGHQYQGHYLQLADLIGVEKETGFTLNYDKYNWDEHQKSLYSCRYNKTGRLRRGQRRISMHTREQKSWYRGTKEVQMAVNEFGEGPFGLYQWTAIQL